MKINVLGTEYEVKKDDLNNPALAENDGVCFIYKKQIILRKKEFLDGDEEEREKRNDHVMMHELIHAFAEESGVQYGNNEELVDWMARMIPLISSAYEKIKSETGE